MRALGEDFEVKLSALPEDLHEQIRDWVNEGRKPGKFLKGILENDLAAGVYHAGPRYRPFLVDIVRFLDWECPNDCWGSPQIMDAWHRRGGLSSEVPSGDRRAA